MTHPHEDDDEDWEAPSAEDADDADDPEPESETVRCPHCRRPVYAGVEQCPNCGEYVSREESSLRQPKWIVITVLICLVLVVLWAVLGW